MTRIGVVVFPGSNCDRDTLRAIELAGAEPVALWHEAASLEGAAAVILPGGFAYGDYLRAGVIARFSPVMRIVSAFAAEGGLVLGICNGFQVVAEAGLVPGALLRNPGLRFLGRDVHVAAERFDTPFTHLAGPRRPLRLPIAHGEGCYFADEATLDELEHEGRVLFRYVAADGSAVAEGIDRPSDANPNGSLRAIAGVLNERGNVAGLMPHPERAAEGILGSDDGFAIIRSLVESARAAERDAGTALVAAGSAVAGPAAAVAR
jgi:phosphoribosylformylglycinamidine synthase subunit PurQ / glutaminase